MAIRLPWPHNVTNIPGGNPMNSLGLVTETYQRTLTYGQIKGMKALLKLVKRLNPRTKLVDMAVNETNYGSPGSGNTYRVRVRYKE